MEGDGYTEMLANTNRTACHHIPEDRNRITILINIRYGTFYMDRYIVSSIQEWGRNLCL